MCLSICAGVSGGYFGKAVFTVGPRLFTVSPMITLLALQVPSLRGGRGVREFIGVSG